MRHLSVLLLLAAACADPGIDEDTALNDSDTDAVQGTDADTEAETDTDADGDGDTEGDFGDPITSDGLENRTYAIDYDDVTWVAPAGASLISGQIPVEYILLHIEDADAQAETIAAVGALGVTGSTGVEQDTCQDVFSFGEQSFTTNPLFNVGPTTLTFPVQGQDVDITNANIQATFVEDGDAITDISIAGRLDTRDFAGITDIDVCATLGIFGASCTACPDGAMLCLDVLLTVDRAEAEDDLVFDPNLVPGGPNCR